MKKIGAFLIIFVTGSGGDLYSVNIDGSNLTHLAGLEKNPTTFYGGVIDPVVSPDGRQIAFIRWDGAEFGVLYTVNVDGTNEQVVVNSVRQARSPAWSPDGSQIMVSFQHGGLRDPKEICVKFDLDDGIRLPKHIRITSSHRSDSGVKICYISMEDLRWGLKVINVKTGKFEDIVPEPYSHTPAWNPKQALQVVYQGDRGLGQINPTNGERIQLTTNAEDGNPVFSPDGSKLALTYRQNDHWEVYTLDLGSGERKRLTKPPILANPQYDSAAPAWSPDGQQIAFVTNRTGQWELWVMNSDGTTQRPLFTPEIQAQFKLRYDGMNERMLGWVS